VPHCCSGPQAVEEFARAAVESLALVGVLVLGADAEDGEEADVGPEVVVGVVVMVVVELPGVCNDWLVFGVQAVTPRPKTAAVRTIRMRRPRELFIIVPFRCIGEVPDGPSCYHCLSVQHRAEAT
jgi:hypothetical protein